MRRLLGVVLATIIVVLPTLAFAQKGQQIFDLFLQGAQQELYRQEQRDYQRRQREEMQRQHRQFLALWQACFRDDLGACDQALGYPHLNFNDRQRLLGKRSQIIAARQEAAEIARRERIEIELQARRRQREQEQQAERDRDHRLAREREDAERQRQRAEQAERERQAAVAQLAAVIETKSLREEPVHTVSASVAEWVFLAALAAVAATLVLLYVFRGAVTGVARRLCEFLARLSSFLGSAFAIKSTQPEKQSAQPHHDPATSGRAPQPAGATQRDTIGAISAMELAYAFIEEIRAADTPGLEDKDGRRHHLNTLALASRQLDAAEKLDPDAVLEGQDEKDDSFRFTINELKSEALLLEGITHQVYDLKRAIPALVAATKANPSNARAFYVLGITHAANMNKANAVAAFQRAVALEPKNIKYRKELSRAESLSAAEIAGYKATRAGERIFDAGVATANAGIMAWNVFAVIWNIVTFPLRMLFAIFRLLRLHPFA